MSSALDITDLRIKVRTLLSTLVVCTTGSISLASSLVGYTRSDGGSFVTDGFAVGMEVLASGFATNNGYTTVTEVTASLLSVAGGRTVEATAAVRTVKCVLPERVVYENLNTDPDNSRQYVEEELLTDAPPQLLGLTSGGVVEHTPQYILRWYFPEDVGTRGPDRCAQKLLELFPAGSTLALADGTFVKVRGDIMPSRSKLTPDKPGWTVCTITIPLRAYTLNT